MKALSVLSVLLSLGLLTSCASPAAPEATAASFPTRAITSPPMEIVTPNATPSPEGEPVQTAQELTGVWLLTSHPDWIEAYWLVREDGSYTFSPNKDGTSGQSGKWSFQDDTFLI